jgi:hypothetical protein
MKWWIPGNVPSSKNSRQWTGKYFIVSKTVTKYRNATKGDYIRIAPQFKHEIAKYTFPLTITFKFIRGSRHKFDYLNPAQTVQDDMVKHEWIDDDNCEFIIPRFEQFEYDKDNPGVWIEIDEKLNKLKDE